MEAKANQDKVGLLSDLVIKQNDRISELNDRVLQLEARLVKSELIVFGIIENKEQSCVQQAQKFLKDVLEIEEPPMIVAAYWKGQSKFKPMVIKFSNPGAKGLVYANVAKLKEKKNSNNKGYRVADHLPEEMDEEQQRQRQIVTQNKLLTGNKLTTSFKKGKLHINNEPYSKKITAPNAKSLLKMEKEDICEVKEITVAGGYSETEGGSRFIGYACRATDLQKVRKAYLHMKRAHADSNHVTMAYRLSSINKAYDEDYVDDREFKAGRKILNLMIQKDCQATVVFMVRYYGGKHIGAKRFEIHQRLTEKALNDLDNGKTYQSKLPLMQLSELTQKRRKRVKPKQRNVPLVPRMMAHPPRVQMKAEGTRFESMAYNRYSALQTQSQSSLDEQSGEMEFRFDDPIDAGGVVNSVTMCATQQSHPMLAYNTNT